MGVGKAMRHQAIGGWGGGGFGVHCFGSGVNLETGRLAKPCRCGQWLLLRRKGLGAGVGLGMGRCYRDKKPGV